MKKSTFAKGFVIMLLVSAISLLGYNRLYKNQLPYLHYVEQLCESGQSLTLDASLPPSVLSKFLVNNCYLEDKKDADAIASHVISVAGTLKNGRLSNLGQLNTAAFRIPSNYIDSVGGESLRQRLEKSRTNIGISEFRENETALHKEVYRESDTAACQITVKIRSKAGLNVSDVPVRLKRHYYDKVDESQFGIIAADSIITYVKTGADGRAVFYVDPENYSVVPVESGYEFGVSKGSTHGELENGRHIFTFDKRNHSINAFSTETYRDIKHDDALTVRTAEYYKQ